MKKALNISAAVFASISIFIQYKAIEFAAGIVDHVTAFGKALATGEASEEITDFFFDQAEKIRIDAQDSFIAQQISLGLLTASILCLTFAALLDRKVLEKSPVKPGGDST